MAESIAEQIMVALQAKLAGIVADGGATYWYTPEKVARYFEFSDKVIARQYAAYFVMVPDDMEAVEEPSFIVREDMSVDIAGLVRIDQGVEDPFDPDSSIPLRNTVQHRILRDAKRALRQDVSLGGLAENVMIPTSELGPERTYLDGWALVFMRVVVEFSYDRNLP